MGSFAKAGTAGGVGLGVAAAVGDETDADAVALADGVATLAAADEVGLAGFVTAAPWQPDARRATSASGWSTRRG